jgi:tRNA uridine 5-carboxymethylaminomethyl modification enzyme
MGRLKTGTCPRVDPATLDHEAMRPQPGEHPPPLCSEAHDAPPLPQIRCHVTHTTPRTHEIIRSALDRSPLFSGTIRGTGPRYCPSIEDKVVRFAHHDRHLLFLEPEGLEVRRTYLSGLSTSLPVDVQQRMVRSLPGCARARILRYGYAVEYDHVDPLALTPALEVDGVRGLFLAGQINGTSGYEEAAGQGLLAGVNAALRARGDEPVTLGRDEAYIGVMVDDLTTRGVDEPYRMFTSRAEYRVLLREDNADARLMPLARRLGLVDDDAYRRFRDRERRLERIERALAERRLGLRDAALMERLNARPGVSVRPGLSLADVLHQPGTDIAELLPAAGLDPVGSFLARRATTRIRYDGYIRRDRQRAAKLLALDAVRIPDSFEYPGLPGLSLEVAEKLARVRPRTLGQASRIPGITPASVALLQVLIRRHRARPEPA